jgi:two-component system cell cycle sensor histidine kinase/response regulator CckA
MRLRIEVGDNGAGMPPEIAANAFDPFFTTKFLGRGMGLAEVLGIMRSHNGGVRMESAPRAGTRVELLFRMSEPSGE